MRFGTSDQDIRRVRDIMQAPDAVFVFGSNLEGIHGAGAARDAMYRWGARWKQGVGPYLQTYAIPTKNFKMRTLSRDRIGNHVIDFLEYADFHHDMTFAVTRIGCGLAGYRDTDIAPLFRDAPRNCLLPIGWRSFNGEEE